MRQVTKFTKNNANTKKPTSKGKKKTAKEKIQAYGMSKLERYFANEFLIKNNVRFIYQYKAENIGRYFDFAVVVNDVPYEEVETNGIKHIAYKSSIPISFIIEVDGDFYHSNPEIYKEEDLTKTQKWNRYVDSIKNKWTEDNLIPILRFWESDIRKNSRKVLTILSNYVKLSENSNKQTTRRKKTL